MARALSIASILEEYGCREKPVTPRIVFLARDVRIEEVFRGSSPVTKPSDLDKARVVPSDAAHALRRLASGDYKQFLESYVEASLCPYITERCRELGPRVVYGLTRLEDGVELYTECFDAYLLLTLVLGDLVGLTTFVKGVRDGVARFTSAYIPREAMDPQLIEELEVFEPPQTSLEPVKTLEKALDAIEALGSEVTELVVSVPCLTEGFVKDAVPRLASLARRGARLILVTRAPTDAETLCPVKSVSRYLVLHLELGAVLRNCYVCTSPSVESSIVVNRSCIITSFEPWLDPGSQIVVVNDRVYANTVATVALRQCICSTPLA